MSALFPTIVLSGIFHRNRVFTWLRQSGRLLTVRLAVIMAAYLAVSMPRVSADGIPEPSLVMYGLVTDASGLRLTNGTLIVSIKRTDGLPTLKVSATLGDVNGQFSYALFIPVETEVPGFTVTASDRLRLTANVLTYDRTGVTLNGTNILYVNTAQTSLKVTSADRGRLERVDFSPNGASAYDSNGLLKSWELRYFGRLGVDPNADPDGDGMPNLDEMLAGTNPTDANSRFAFQSVSPDAGGGIRVVWSTQPGRNYQLWRSQNLLNGFEVLGPVQPATPPVNTYIDTTATGAGPYFYRAKLTGP